MKDIQKQLSNLEVNPGDVILVHSSMKALGTDKTPYEFLKLFQNYLTDKGTLLLPALTYDSVTTDKPVFSIKKSVPCVGILPKTFMEMDGVWRSMHPTHSVFACGYYAEEITNRHIGDNTPVGPNSPFMLLPEYNGKILFIGDILDSCTFMHGLEEIVNAPYTLNKKQTEYTLEDENGKAIKKKYFTHDFKGWEQEYTRISKILTPPYIKTGKIINANCTVINAAKLKTAAIERFKDDIYYFVSPA